MGAPLDTRDAALWVTIREGDDGDMSECLLARSTLCDPWRTKFVQDGDDTSSWCLAHSFGSGFLTAELAWRVRTSFAHTARATLHRHGNSLAQVLDVADDASTQRLLYLCHGRLRLRQLEPLAGTV